VDGDLGIYLGETQPIFDISLDLLLVHVLGTVTFEGTEHDVDLSFRLIDERLLEVAIPADNGDVVFDLAEGLETSALRTGNGSFCCWFADRQCASVASETCEGEPGDNVWTW
jgi:hypothetical protein